jgi:hypothetical protein
MVPTAVHTPLAVHLVGRASKRGLIPRLPTGERLLADAEAWLRAEYPDVVGSTRRRLRASGEAELALSVHPAATDVVVSADDAGEVAVTADTAAPGPGYHTFVDRLVDRLGSELSIAWLPPDVDGAPAVDAPVAAAQPRPAIERSYLAWLGTALAGARDARRSRRPVVHVGTPPGVRFTVDAVVATALGPRDDVWLERALADWHAALDIVPWWADATDARYLLNRALCLMWTEVRWRSPASPAERAVLDDVARLLKRALPLDPSLPYPWQAWLELLELRGLDDAVGRQVAARAAATPAGSPPIGYRRLPVTAMHAGWSLEVPGSFAEQRTDEEWAGGEGGRSITLAAVETGRDGAPMAPEAFLDLVAGDLGADALVHHSGGVVGRARLRTDGSSGVEVGVLDGYSAVAGSGAAIRVVFDDPADWEWALATWRSLTAA